MVSHLCLESQIWTVDSVFCCRETSKVILHVRQAKLVWIESSNKLDQQNFIGGERQTVPPHRSCNVDPTLQTKPIYTEPPLRQCKCVVSIREEPVTSLVSSQRTPDPTWRTGQSVSALLPCLCQRTNVPEMRQFPGFLSYRVHAC